MSGFPVSVVMPVYNAEKYLPRAIESVLEQTHGDFELVIVDNMSEDSSLEIATDYARRDPRIRTLTCRERGFSRALNLGVREARHPWIARMDADDVSLPQRLEVQINFLKENPGLSALGSYGYYMDEAGRRKLGRIKVGPTSLEEYREIVRKGKLLFMLNVSMMIKREVFLALGGYRNLPVLEDLDFNCRMAQEGHLALVLPEYLVMVRKTSSSETSRKFFLAQNIMRWLKYSMEARRKGDREPTLEEFLEGLKRQPLVKKINRYREDLGALYFKRAGLALSYRKPAKFMFSLALSLMLSPDYAVKKLRSILR